MASTSEASCILSDGRVEDVVVKYDTGESQGRIKIDVALLRPSCGRPSSRAFSNEMGLERLGACCLSEIVCLPPGRLYACTELFRAD